MVYGEGQRGAPAPLEHLGEPVTVAFATASENITTTPRGPEGLQGDALLEWAAGLGYGLRAWALTLSDMPTPREVRDGLGVDSVHGGALPNRTAALAIAGWVAQGVTRAGGVLKLWAHDYAQRREGIRMTARQWRKACEPFGGKERHDDALAVSSMFWGVSGIPPRTVSVRLALLSTPCGEVDGWGIDPDDAGDLLRTECADDLNNLQACIPGLVFRRGREWTATFHGRPLTSGQFAELHKYL